MHRLSRWMCLTILMGTTLLPATAGGQWTVEVQAGKHDRVDTPVRLELPRTMAHSGGWRLVRLSDETAVPVQADPLNALQLTWIIRDPLKAGESRRYRLEKVADNTASNPALTTAERGPVLELRRGAQTVLAYHLSAQEPPPGIDPVYRRSGYIHPLSSPSGHVVTDDFAPDHAHQHAVFFAWVNTTYDGRHVDFWNQRGGTGGVAHDRLLSHCGGDVFAEFQSTLRHFDLTIRNERATVLHELWSVRLYNIDPFTLVDLNSQQTCATKLPLTINEYHYGGMAVRGSRSWFQEGVPAAQQPGQFLTSEGKQRIEGNHSRPAWVSLSGLVDGEPCGMVVMGHPTNFRFPQPVRLHPTKPYFCFAPMVLGSFDIEADRAYESRYRYLVHDGPLDRELANRVWQDYAEPPAARLLAVDP